MTIGSEACCAPLADSTALVPWRLSLPKRKRRTGE